MGLPIRVVIPLLAIFAVIFLGIMTYLLRIGFATEGSAFGTSAPHAAAGPNAGPPAPVMAALADLQSRVAKSPRDTTALVALGELYFEAGKYDQALAYNERALAVDPKLASALFAKAADLEGLGKRPQAIAAYKKFLRDAPDDARTADARIELSGLSK